MFKQVCGYLGIPFAPEKLQFGQQVEYLGVIIDTSTWSIYFSEKKLEKLKRLVAEWKGCVFATRKKVQSMIGKLLHASIVYFGGGTFTRPLIHKLKAFKEQARIKTATYPEIALSLE
jgi:hypothetical protein